VGNCHQIPIANAAGGGSSLIFVGRRGPRGRYLHYTPCKLKRDWVGILCNRAAKGRTCRSALISLLFSEECIGVAECLL
jgi:hypothetical protein